MDGQAPVLHVTGHSLGGSMATLCAYDFACRAKAEDKKVHGISPPPCLSRPMRVGVCVRCRTRRLCVRECHVGVPSEDAAVSRTRPHPRATTKKSLRPLRKWVECCPVGQGSP